MQLLSVQYSKHKILLNSHHNNPDTMKHCPGKQRHHSIKLRTMQSTGGAMLTSQHNQTEMVLVLQSC